MLPAQRPDSTTSPKTFGWYPGAPKTDRRSGYLAAQSSFGAPGTGVRRSLDIGGSSALPGLRVPLRRRSPQCHGDSV
jgi:hypothetical protein